MMDKNLIEQIKDGNLQEARNIVSEKLDTMLENEFSSYEAVIKQAVYENKEVEIEDAQIVDENEEFDPEAFYFWSTINEEDEELSEKIRRVIKINSKGEKRIKKKCGKGFKLVDNKCVKISGSEKATLRKSQKKRKKTLKSKGSILKKRTRLFKKAIKKRLARGL